MKRTLAFLLAICLIFGQVPTTVFATASDSAPDEIAEHRDEHDANEPPVPPEEKADTIAATSGTCGENLTWTLSDDGVLTISGTGPMPNYSASSAVPWYGSRSSITAVRIENGVSTIGRYAFKFCDSLISVEISDSVVAINDSAFYYCEKLESVKLGNGLQVIGNDAFGFCDKLIHIRIPENVFSIKKNAFEYCTNMVAFSVDPDNAYFSNDDAGVLFDKEKTVLLQAPGAISGDYTVPDTVISINDTAFVKCNQLIHVSIGNQVQVIGANAFYGCDQLETVFISANVRDIASNAFWDCESLREITVDRANSWYSSDEYGVLFDKTQSTLIQAPGAIGGTYTIPDTVTTISSEAFCNCNDLTGIAGGENLTSIGWRAFSYCDNLYSVALSDSVTHMDYYVFAECNNLTSVQFGSGLSEINTYTFYQCKRLKDVHLPEGIQKIGYGAFYGCSGLEEIELPCNVTLIDEWAFAKCSCLAYIGFTGHAPEILETCFIDTKSIAYYPANDPTWTDNVMQNYGGGITWVPWIPGSVIASGWSGYTQWNLRDNGTLTFSGTGNMKNYDYDEVRPWEAYVDGITSVIIEAGVTSIGECAFKGLTNLEFVQIPDSGLLRIGEAAFYGCASLKEINIPDSVYTIPDYAFKNCVSLSDIRLSKDLIKIGEGAFENCTSLDYIFIPGDTEIIGAWSFKGCTSLEEVDMQWADATEIREGAFKNCSSLTEIILPTGIRTLGDSCFYGIGATTFIVPETVTSVEPWCFARAKVTEIVFEGNAPDIGEGAFNKISLAAYYPDGNATWTDEVMQNYGGKITWKAN